VYIGLGLSAVRLPIRKWINELPLTLFFAGDKMPALNRVVSKRDPSAAEFELTLLLEFPG